MHVQTQTFQWHFRQKLNFIVCFHQSLNRNLVVRQHSIVCSFALEVWEVFLETPFPTYWDSWLKQEGEPVLLNNLAECSFWVASVHWGWCGCSWIRELKQVPLNAAALGCVHWVLGLWLRLWMALSRLTLMDGFGNLLECICGYKAGWGMSSAGHRKLLTGLIALFSSPVTDWWIWQIVTLKPVLSLP